MVNHGKIFEDKVEQALIAVNFPYAREVMEMEQLKARIREQISEVQDE